MFCEKPLNILKNPEQAFQWFPSLTYQMSSFGGFFLTFQWDFDYFKNQFFTINFCHSSWISISLSTFIIIIFFSLFISFWLCWVFIAVGGFSLVAASGGYSSLWCVGFSLGWLLLLWSKGSRCAGFSSCGAWAQLFHSMWDLPRPGLEPMSPALAGGFLTTAPPGKPRYF